MATFGTFVSGQVLTAAELNSGGTFSSYTPTWTQSATITKTTNWARYTQFNKLVMGSIKMTASSAGTANNKMLVGLPVAASANNFIVGSMMFFDASSVNDISNPYFAFYESSTTMSFFVGRVSSVSNDMTIPDAAGPTTDVRFGQNYTNNSNAAITGITVASGDIVYVQFMYEAA